MYSTKPHELQVLKHTKVYYNVFAFMIFFNSPTLDGVKLTGKLEI